MTDNNNAAAGQGLGFLGAAVSVEDAAFGSIFPVVQWVHGDKSKGKDAGIGFTGGFFISGEQGLDKPEGWTDYTLITSDAEEIVGFSIRDLRCAPLRSRRCWDASPEEGLSRRFGWNEYEDAKAFSDDCRGKGHLLVAVEGIEEPLLLSFSGFANKAVLGQGSERGVIPMFSSKIPQSATRMAKKAKKNIKYPRCAFYLTIGPARDEKGAPAYTKAGTGSKTSMVTLPMWIDAPKGLVSQALLQRLYVGDEMFAVYQDWHRDADEWVGEWNADTLHARWMAGRGRGAAAAAAAGAAPAASGLPGDQAAPF